MERERTTEAILYSVFYGDDGLRAAAGLARMGSIFLDQILTDPRQMAEQNLVKQYLRQAGFSIKLVKNPEPFVSPEERTNPLQDVLRKPPTRGAST